METTVNKWGNSLAVRIPSKLTKGFSDGTRIKVERKGDSLILSPEIKKVLNIEDLVKLVSKNNLNIEPGWSSDNSVGKEIL